MFGMGESGLVAWAAALSLAATCISAELRAAERAGKGKREHRCIYDAGRRVELVAEQRRRAVAQQDDCCDAGAWIGSPVVFRVHCRCRCRSGTWHHGSVETCSDARPGRKTSSRLGSNRLPGSDRAPVTIFEGIGNGEVQVQRWHPSARKRDPLWEGEKRRRGFPFLAHVRLRPRRSPLFPRTGLHGAKKTGLIEG